MDVELTWLDDSANMLIDMEEVEAHAREWDDLLRRWEAGESPAEEAFEQYALAEEAGLYGQFAVGAYLLLRQHVSSHPWRHGLDLDEIVRRDGRLFWKTPERRYALYDKRWLDNTDGDLWHDSIVEVLRWIERHGVSPRRLMALMLDDQPRLVKMLRNFKVNARRRRHLIKEFPVGNIPDGYVDVHDDPERTEEKPPPKGFRVPPPHSWRYQYLAADPFEALDLEVDVRWALARLGEVDRYLFIRHFAYGDTARSLAVDIPRGTVNKKLVTAMRRVREYLNETPPKKRGRPPKKNIENGYSNDPKSCLTI